MSAQVDRDYLFTLARNKSVEGRAVLTQVISDLFDDRHDALSDREKHLMFGIMHELIHDVEVSVRKNISTRLAGLTDVPPALVEELANDEIDVAYPILTESQLLRDEALVDIVRLRTHEHQLAVTLRREISEEVSAALVEHGDERVVVSLLQNDNAKISGATMEFLVDQSKRVDAFQDPLLRRDDLREELATKMFMWVSAALRNHIVERYELDLDIVEELLEEAAQDGIDQTLSHAPDKAGTLSRTLKEEGLVTADMIVAALLDGEASLFLNLFATLTGLNNALASRIIFEEGGEALAIACKAVGVSEMQFALIFERTRKARPKKFLGSHRDQSNKEVYDLYRRIPKEEATHVVNRWRRGSDFLSAIRELKH